MRLSDERDLTRSESSLHLVTSSTAILDSNNNFIHFNELVFDRELKNDFARLFSMDKLNTLSQLSRLM